MTFTYTDGYQEITKLSVTVTITGNKGSKVYNASEQSVTGYEIEISNPLYTEGKINGIAQSDAIAKGTLVSTYPMNLKAGTFTEDAPSEQFSNTDENFDVTFVVVNGELIITDGTNPDDPEEVKDDLVVTKTAENKQYKLGEAVTFTITATNIYAEARNITLTEIEGVTLETSTFENVAGGATITTTATYTITEADILKGSFTNTVTAAVGKITKTAEATVETEKKNGHLTITKVTTKEPANGKAFALGEEITYKITVTNDGNLTITNITVTDELTGDEWTIRSLAPGKNKEFTTAYTVQEKDILAGEVLNVATGKGTSPDPDNPDVPVDPGKDPEPTEPKNGHLTIKKVTTSKAAAADGKYALGEKITYKITATNDGNLTLTNVEVVDELTNDKWTVQSLAPGASEEFETSYTVTEEDILAGEVVNVATGKGTSPDPENPDVPVDPGKDPEPTEEKKGHLTINKVTTSKPANGSAYMLGEKIEYKITVTNDGNLTIKDITVTDELTKDEWKVASLAPKESKEFKTSYTVTAADIMAGVVVNVATGKGTSPDPDEPKVPVVPGKDSEPTVRIIVPVYPVPEPTRVVPVPGNGSNPDTFIDDYGAPLGLSNASLNAGECIE